MLPFYSVHVVMLVAFAVVYYKAAEIEDVPRMLWAGLSIGVYALTWQFVNVGSKVQRPSGEKCSAGDDCIAGRAVGPARFGPPVVEGY